MNAKLKGLLVAAGLGCLGSQAVAQVAPDPVSFRFTFCGESNSATATGYITFDANQMSNPFPGIDYSAVLDLEVTVANASAGNGTFFRDDFADIAWSSNGAVMDLNTELVGQPTNDLPWGTTPSSGEAGDFNLFESGNTAGAPEGVFYFLLGADEGDAEAMSLRTFSPGPNSIGAPLCPPPLRPTIVGVPVMSAWGTGLFIVLLLSISAFGIRRVRAG